MKFYVEMTEFLRMCIIVCPLVFVAGFVDSVAGGGGTISLPAYLLAGLPTHLAAGTNKLSASCGTLVATVKYIKGGKILWAVALPGAVAALMGSFAGAELAMYFSDKTLKLLLLAALPCIVLFLTFKKDLGSDDVKPKNYSAAVTVFISIGIGLVIGLYDGLIGPGTGTFLIIAFSGLLGVDMLTASGCAKVCNLASNAAAVVVYAVSGKILYTLAAPAVVCAMAGNWLGARYAMKGGSKNVRRVMYVVLVILFIKAALDLLGVTIN